MTRPSAFFLTPEKPSLIMGGGGMRSASVLAYLQCKYDVDVAGFDLPEYSRSPMARIARNSLRLVRGRPPLFDRYSGFEEQIQRQVKGHYRVSIIEHSWCAEYATVLRPHSDLLVLDLHNIESALAHSHAKATQGAESFAFEQFARAYEKLEGKWLPRFDVVLVPSEEDRARVKHSNVVVYPNALPKFEAQNTGADVTGAQDRVDAEYIVFSGNLEYHPNIEAVRWFRTEVWPLLREEFPSLEWWLVGRNPQAIRRLIEDDQRIKVTGAVNDVIPLIAGAKAAVVPLLSGSGTRFKILEAWQAKRAVVSTRIGAEGLEAKHEEHLLLANSAKDFLRMLSMSLKTPALRLKLGENGHTLCRERYVWPVAWRALGSAGI